MKRIFTTHIGKFFAGAAIAAALFAGSSTPALAQTPMTALSASTNFTIINLGSVSGTPSSNYSTTIYYSLSYGTSSSFGVAVIGNAGTVSFCSGWVGQGVFGYAAGVPVGSCVVAGRISTPISAWSYTIEGPVISLINQVNGNLVRCSGLTNLNTPATAAAGCQNLGNMPK